VAIVPLQMVVIVAWGQPDTALGWFDLFGRNELARLLSFELLFVINAVLGVGTTLALYVALRRVNESLMTVALALGLLEAVAFVAARPALEMLYLSDRYASAATDAQRDALLAAGEAVPAGFACDVRRGMGSHMRPLVSEQPGKRAERRRAKCGGQTAESPLLGAAGGRSRGRV